ncbi:MAG: hypothetical protein PHP51_07445 [Desulfotomaculaceae bacterium]|nr:hypothetical protein [Desulfotomaculaceae bacterium]MDD4767011.1 hypothetical protein [Desulfotomaculaceae bacterium]
MEKQKVEVLKKLARRRKMFEDYIVLLKKQDGVKSGLRAAVRGKLRSS